MAFSFALAIIALVTFILLVSEKKKRFDKIAELNHLLEQKNNEIKKQSDDLRVLYKQLRTINKTVEEEIKRTTERVTLQNKKIIEHTYDYSHKMRKPLERIRGFVLLLQLEDFTQKPDDVLVNLNDAIEELDKHVNELTERLHS